MKKLSKLIAGASVFAIAGVAAIAPLTGTAHADSAATQLVQVTVPSSITITQVGDTTGDSANPVTSGPTATIAGDTSASGGTNSSAPQAIGVTTNSALGFSLYLQMNGLDSTVASASAADGVNTFADNGLHNITNTGASPIAASSNTVPGALAANTWGVSINGSSPDAGSTYVGVPSTTGTTAPLLIGLNAAGSAYSPTQVNNYVNYGANTNAATAAGVYQNTVLYTAVANS